MAHGQCLGLKLTFLLAGHETTALALTYTLALLGDAPWLRSAASELGGDSGRPPARPRPHAGRGHSVASAGDGGRRVS